MGKNYYSISNLLIDYLLAYICIIFFFHSISCSPYDIGCLTRGDYFGLIVKNYYSISNSFIYSVLA